MLGSLNQREERKNPSLIPTLNEEKEIVRKKKRGSYVGGAIFEGWKNDVFLLFLMFHVISFREKKVQ